MPRRRSQRPLWELATVALKFLAICEQVPEEGKRDSFARETFAAVGQSLQREVEMHAQTPLESLLGSKLSELQGDFLQPMQPSGHTRQVVSRLLSLSRRLCEYANWIIWRDTHYLWLTDSLHQGEVVHSAWGDIGRWDELGANDARARHMLQDSQSRPPAFAFSHEAGQRQEILTSLLRQLHKARGDDGPLIVVEIGVFRAQLSKFILEKLPFVQLLGVDPYIGTDGTFPGDYSVTLAPDQALAAATAVFQSFGGRAELLPATSGQAASQMPDGSVDAIFVDGCHLYECVNEDLAAWLPKLRLGAPGGALVAGHDFSPQWPGVVRAVHEYRHSGRKVFLGMDWTYWWYLE